LKPSPAAIPVVLTQEEFTLTKADQAKFRDKDGKEATRRQRQHKVTLAGGKPHVFMAYAKGAANIGLFVMVEGKVVIKSEGAWYPAVRFTPPKDTEAEIYIVGPDSDVTYTLTDYGFDAPKS
jgi:hypothetical protein